MKITKKNGMVCLFDDEKVVKSILRASKDTDGEPISRKMAEALADEVFTRLTARHEIITTADVRACVYALLRERGFPKTAESYRNFKK
jgi:transcriptional regulator NrdR family protein